MVTAKSKQANGLEMRRQRDLRLNEQVIENARQSFLDMGRALAAILDGRLYEGDYDSFDEYASDRWEFTGRQAYRLVTAHRINLILRPIGHSLGSEAAARELVPLAEDEAMLVAVYEEAVRRAAGGRITAALVKAARDDLAPIVIEGELADPLAAVPQAQAAVEAKLAERAATQDPPVDHPSSSDTTEGADTRPRTGGGEGRPEQDRQDSTPGEADEGADLSAADDAPTSSATIPLVGATAGGETGIEVSTPVEVSDPVDGREQQVTGVSPAAPGPADDDEAWCAFIYPHQPHDDDERGVLHAFACPGVSVPSPVALMRALADQFELLDVDALGPLMTGAEMEELGAELLRVTNVVDLLTHWYERAQA